MKYSKQREIILETLSANPIHPTADQIYFMIKVIDPKISLATVYRNLNLLAENGIIKKIEGLDGVARFDHNTHNHYHFICTKCNKVYDVPYEIAPDVVENISARTGLTIESCHVSLSGICHECKNKKTKYKELN